MSNCSLKSRPYVVQQNVKLRLLLSPRLTYSTFLANEAQSSSTKLRARRHYHRYQHRGTVLNFVQIHLTLSQFCTCARQPPPRSLVEKPIASQVREIKRLTSIYTDTHLGPWYPKITHTDSNMSNNPYPTIQQWRKGTYQC